MKKYFILFICLIGVLFSSCVEKEDPYSWSIGQMEIDESSPEVVAKEKVELPSTITTKSKVAIPDIEDAIVLQTKCMGSKMLMLVQIPNNPVSKYDYWKDSDKDYYAIIGLIYPDEDHHKFEGKVYRDYDKALTIFNAGYIKESE